LRWWSIELETKKQVLLGLFTGSVLTANFIASVKLTNLFGMVVPAGFIAYSITFPITDIVSEVWGKKEARRFVWAGFAANIGSLLLILLAYLLPPLYPEMQDLYSRAFMPMARIVLASMVAYLASQHLDVDVFFRVKELTKGRYLWLRNNVGEAVAQAVDTAIFITLAFYGIVPTSVLLNMMFTQWVWKIVVNLLDTPFVYLGIKLVNGRQ